MPILVDACSLSDTYSWLRTHGNSLVRKRNSASETSARMQEWSEIEHILQLQP